MVKNFIYSLFAALAFVGCSAAGEELQSTGEEQVVAVSMDISRIDGDTDTSSSLLDSESSILRITDANENLIRRYSPASDVPSTLQLANGSYSATLSLGSKVAASKSIDDCYYWGEDSFTVGETPSTLDLDAKICNTAIKVKFDDTIAVNFEEGYSVKAIFEEGGEDEVSLTFTEDESGEMGYFLDYENDYADKKITWEFSGVRNEYTNDIDGADRTIVLKGKIENPQVGELNTLSFKYTPYFINTNIGLTVDVNPTVFDDNLDFALQPTIALDGYTELNIPYDDSDLTFIITKAMSSIAAVTVEGITTPIEGTSGETESYKYSVTAENNVLFTVKSGTLTDLTAGLNAISVTATDSANSTGRGEFGLFRSGWVNPLSWDTWAMSANFDIALAWSEESTVKVQYSAKDSGVWLDAVGDIEYNSYGANISVKAAPSWSSANNSSGLTYYHSPTNGIVVGNNYEYRVVVGDSESYPISGEFTASGGTPNFVDGDFEDSSLKCFGSNGSNSTSWASGNNSNASELCNQTTFTGRTGHGVEMFGTETGLLAWKYLGAGNLFYGQFLMDGTNGTVKFGQPFTWESRPRKVRFDYAAYLGTVDYTNNNILTSGSKDIGRIYVAVVDWSGRHETTSGTSGTSGAWDPIDNDSGKGKVIGYASLFISEEDEIGVLNSSDKPADLTTRELEFYYYDTKTKPTNNITLVVSCSSSAYGHYFDGSTKSRLWIDNFELVY